MAARENGEILFGAVVRRNVAVSFRLEGLTRERGRVKEGIEVIRRVEAILRQAVREVSLRAKVVCLVFRQAKKRENVCSPEKAIHGRGVAKTGLRQGRSASGKGIRGVSITILGGQETPSWVRRNVLCQVRARLIGV